MQKEAKGKEKARPFKGARITFFNEYGDTVYVAKFSMQNLKESACYGS